MKTQILSTLVITALIIVFVTGCKKDETSTTNSQELILKKINQYIPDADAKTKVKMLNAFREKAVAKESNQLKSAIEFEDTPADLARYLIETTLNTDFANVYDSTLTNFTKTSVQLVVNNNGMTDEGTPILDGESLTDAYLDLEQAAEELNTETTTFYLSSIQVNSYSETSTTFDAELTSADGASYPYVHLPIVLKPWETPVPFTSGESYYPVSDYPSPYSNTNPNPNWAGAKIEAKLNAHYINLLAEPHGFIIERAFPDGYFSFMDHCNDNLIWGGYWNGSTPLNYIQLNTYLTNYKAFLDQVNTPYGYNNVYVMRAEIYHWDQPYYAQSQNPPLDPQYYYWICPDNYNSYTDWHYLDFPRVKFIPIPDPD